MKQPYRRSKGKHGKKGRFRWQFLALAAAVVVGGAALRQAITLLTTPIADWAWWPAASAPTTGEPDEDFRPEVGDPPYTIAVDAGHGGTDPGATGVVVEREMTAATADALLAWLEADPNYLPVTTRENYEVTATPAERVERSNSQNPDLLLSIHGNSAAAGSTASGFECYPITPGRSWHRESVYFARLLAAGMANAGSSLRGVDGVRYIYYVNGERSLTESNDIRVRDEDTFTILEQSECPAVLAEQCFVTSAEDVDRFGDADGCQLAARVYYEAICAYFGTQPLAQTS